MASRFRQDMPPSGGYGPVDWAKKIPKNRMSGYAFFAALGLVSGSGWMYYIYERKQMAKSELEMRDARIALEPFMFAEQHRAFLTHIRKNRDEENELMKDVPGWETGKIDGEPVYFNLANRWPHVHPEEYYAHNHRWKDMYDRLFERRKH